jgi:hypothetical protein
MRLSRAFVPLLAAFGALALVAAASASAAANNSTVVHARHVELSSSSTSLAKRLTFRNAMGKYWEDHITWTRLYIVAALSNSPDLQPTTMRLLQNQVDIGNAIRPYYGDAAGDQLTALLREHILIAADLVAAAKAGDSAAVERNTTRWQANADDIAEFLSSANPDNWPAAEMKAMMREHLDLTTQEVVARLRQDWSADIAAYDQVHLHILQLADVLTSGIIAQFPSEFEVSA